MWQPKTLDHPVQRIYYSRDVVLKWRNHLSQFEVVEPFEVLWTDGDGETRALFTVRAGFITNLSSIPQAARSVFPQVAHHLQPAVVHDWLYEYDENLTRLEADDMFLEAMEAEGVAWWRRHTMYRAVRAFGEGDWRRRGKGVGPLDMDWEVLG